MVYCVESIQQKGGTQMSILKLPEKETQGSTEVYPEEEQVLSTLRARSRKKLKAELIMVGIAALCAVVLAAMLVMSLPYMGSNEDPESLQNFHAQATEAAPTEPVFLEPTISETEPENPTIPPDPHPHRTFDLKYDRDQ